MSSPFKATEMHDKSLKSAIEICATPPYKAMSLSPVSTSPMRKRGISANAATSQTHNSYLTKLDYNLVDDRATLGSLNTRNIITMESSKSNSSASDLAKQSSYSNGGSIERDAITLLKPKISARRATKTDIPPSPQAEGNGHINGESNKYFPVQSPEASDKPIPSPNAATAASAHNKKPSNVSFQPHSNNARVLNHKAKEQNETTIYFDTPTEIPATESNFLQDDLNKWTLSFRDREIEQEYAEFFTQINMYKWRTGLLFGLTLAFILFFYNGLYGEDSLMYETLFMCFSAVLPLVVLLCASFVMTIHHNETSKFAHIFASMAMAIFGAVGISARHYVMEQRQSPYKTGLFYILLLMGAHVMLQIRYFYLAICMPLLFIVFTTESAMVMQFGSLGSIQDLVISSICLATAMLVIASSSYTMERATREDFLQARASSNTTLKLIEQLKRLHKTYTHQVADFDSPLEKSIMLVKSILADPSLQREHVSSLGTLLALLKCGDLLTPDIERQVEGGWVDLDEDQEAWLFSNLYRNRQSSKPTIVRNMIPYERAKLSEKIPFDDLSPIAFPKKYSLGGESLYAPPLLSEVRNPSYSSASGSPRKKSAGNPDKPALLLKQSSGDYILGSDRRQSVLLRPSESPKYGARRQSLVQQMVSNKLEGRRISCVSNKAISVKEKQSSDSLKASLKQLNESGKDISADDIRHMPSNDRGGPATIHSITDKALIRSAQPSVDPLLASEVAQVILAFGAKLSINEKSSDNYMTKLITEIDNLPSEFGTDSKGNTNILEFQNLNTIKEGEEELGSVASFGGQNHLVSSAALSIAHSSSVPASPEDMATHISIVRLLERSDCWNWEIFELNSVTNGWVLFSLSYYLFAKSDLFNKLKIDKKSFLKFASHIECGYHADVSYHNSIHAADVLHGMTWLKDRCSSIAVPTDLELMSMYIAAMIHDFDGCVCHIAKIGHELQLSFESFQGRLQELSRNGYRVGLGYRLANATFLDALNISVTETFDPENSREDRLLLWKMMIKCADVGNPTKTWELYDKWTERVLEEFFNQGDHEKRHGIPISPYYDRETIYIPSSQLGFIEFICMPLFETFHSFKEISCILEGLHSNRMHWLQCKEEDQRNAAHKIESSTPQGSNNNLVAASLSSYISAALPARSKIAKELKLSSSTSAVGGLLNFSPKSSVGNLNGGNASSFQQSSGLVKKATTKSYRSASGASSSSVDLPGLPAPSTNLSLRDMFGMKT